MVKQHFFSSQNIVKRHIKSFFKDKQTRKKFKVFDQSHGLKSLVNANILDYVKMAFLQATKRLRKCKLFDCVKMTFLQATKPSFLAAIPSTRISNHFCKKKKVRRNFIFFTKILGQPRWKKMLIFRPWQSDIFVLQEALFFIQNIIKHHLSHLQIKTNLKEILSFAKIPSTRLSNRFCKKKKLRRNFDYGKVTFLCSRKPSFLSRTSSNIFSK